MANILEDPYLQLPLAFILGLIVGSFLNVIIYRLPRRMETELEAACREHAGDEVEHEPNSWFGLKFLLTPPSTCPSCGTKISVQYPVLELLSGLLSLVVVWHFGFTSQALAALILTWALLAMSVIDIRIQILPDVLILPLIWLGLLLNLDGMFTNIHSAIYGAVAGYLSLWFIFHLFLLITGKEGMGYGDFKLFALFGAWLGWQLLPQILLLSAAVGAITGIGMIVFLGRDRSIPIPFGPYLAAAGWIALLWGEEINRSYLKFAGL